MKFRGASPKNIFKSEFILINGVQHAILNISSVVSGMEDKINLITNEIEVERRRYSFQALFNENGFVMRKL